MIVAQAPVVVTAPVPQGFAAVLSCLGWRSERASADDRVPQKLTNAASQARPKGMKQLLEQKASQRSDS